MIFVFSILTTLCVCLITYWGIPEKKYYKYKGLYYSVVHLAFRDTILISDKARNIKKFDKKLIDTAPFMEVVYFGFKGLSQVESMLVLDYINNVPDHEITKEEFNK